MENHDLSGVDIYPFTQLISMNREQFENSMEFVRNNAANAIAHEEMFTSASNTKNILEYLSNNGLIK